MEKYLRLYAEPEAAALGGIPQRSSWSHVLVIPACNERSALLRPPPVCAGRSLLILVVNQSVGASAEVSAANQALAEAVRDRFEPVWHSDPSVNAPAIAGLQLFSDQKSPRDVLLVDRFGPGRELPLKGGVGHARKIGADLATALIHRGLVQSPWIHCSDGDVELPATYFEVVDATAGIDSGCAALIYPFEHVLADGGDPEVLRATRLYELSLHYYVAGLRFAQSPYAFHTIGSTIAVHASYYAKVRGVPKREAGEDFYLLNKLSKAGAIRALAASPACLPIRIEARRSDRVPFGTGAAVTRISGLADPVRDTLYYQPEVFGYLRRWLSSWRDIWASGTPDYSSIMTGQRDNAPGLDPQPLVLALGQIQAGHALEHAFRQSKSLDQFTRHLHTWFDAFRTLKLIHALRNSHYPSIDYSTLAAHPMFLAWVEHDDALGDFYRSQMPRIEI